MRKKEFGPKLSSQSFVLGQMIEYILDGRPLMKRYEEYALNETTVGDDPVNPAHYRDVGEFSAVHIIPKWNVGFEVGNALKYIQRAGKKPGQSEEQDLKKAVWYLNRKLHLINPDNLDPARNDR